MGIEPMIIPYKVMNHTFTAIYGIITLLLSAYFSRARYNYFHLFIIILLVIFEVKQKAGPEEMESQHNKLFSKSLLILANSYVNRKGSSFKNARTKVGGGSTKCGRYY